MKKILVLVGLLLFSLSANAYENTQLTKEVYAQKYINEVGTEILNANFIDKRVVFTYDKTDKEPLLDDKTVTKRQIVFYDKYFKYIDNDDELAAFLAREISRAVMSYSGEWGGFVGATQVKAAPKKYEIFADKRAVNYMVRAGYNPLGLITFINKSEPQHLLGKLTHNRPSKRMAIVYEYIYYNYPEYLENSTYLKNPNYQNFLLNSTENRKLLKEKIEKDSKEEIKYE